jgi:NADP-dependent 3-hydroxy acid dehydrogenase YdfG
MCDVEIKERKAVITGAARGLGRALAIVLADAGAELIIAGRDPAKLAEVAGTIAARGRPRPEWLALDLADRASVDAAVERIGRSASSPDILINNGARWLSGSLEDSTPDEIAETIASQLTGTILLTRALLPLLRQAGHADVLTIVSTSGLPNARLSGASPAFHAAKHGQAGFASGLRQALIGSGVRSTAIYPSDIEDIQPDGLAWASIPERPKHSSITNRDVVEAAIFVLTRPRHVTIADMTLDAETGGLCA